MHRAAKCGIPCAFLKTIRKCFFALDIFLIPCIIIKVVKTTGKKVGIHLTSALVLQK
jgi:hypothetical protein